VQLVALKLRMTPSGVRARVLRVLLKSILLLLQTTGAALATMDTPGMRARPNRLLKAERAALRSFARVLVCLSLYARSVPLVCNRGQAAGGCQWAARCRHKLWVASVAACCSNGCCRTSSDQPCRLEPPAPAFTPPTSAPVCQDVCADGQGAVCGGQQLEQHAQVRLEVAVVIPLQEGHHLQVSSSSSSNSGSTQLAWGSTRQQQSCVGLTATLCCMPGCDAAVLWAVDACSSEPHLEHNTLHRPCCGLFTIVPVTVTAAAARCPVSRLNDLLAMLGQAAAASATCGCCRCPCCRCRGRATGGSWPCAPPPPHTHTLGSLRLDAAGLLVPEAVAMGGWAGS
jgi:hypothetical protein